MSGEHALNDVAYTQYANNFFEGPVAVSRKFVSVKWKRLLMRVGNIDTGLTKLYVNNMA